MIDLDFETFSKIDIRMGPWRYTEDKSTEILTLSFKVGLSSVARWRPGLPIPKWVKNRVWELFGEGCVIAHNAMFEKAVWRNILVKRFGWPDIPDEFWSCSAAKCAAHALPRDLEQACLVMDTTVKKDMAGKRSMLKLSKPRKPTKNNPEIRYTRAMYPDDFAVLDDYCDTDVLSEACLNEQIRDLSTKERKIWLLDQKINASGVYIDAEAVRGAIKIIESYEMACGLELAALSENEFDSVTQLFAIKAWLEGKGYPVASLDKAAVEELLTRESLPNDVRRVLELRQSLGKTSTKKLGAMLGAICADGRVKDLLMYHGASTGRWTGKNIQVQNFPRTKVKDLEEKIAALRTGKLSKVRKYGDPMHLISSCLRGMLMAAPGHRVFAADYAAIEARGVCWLSGQESTLKRFRRGEDVYRVMAAIIYGIHLDEVDGGAPDGPMRQLGKQAILGCGYGMGPPKFQATCEGYKMAVDLALAEKAVGAYRETNEEVVRFWYAQERAAKAAVKTRRMITCGPIRWAVIGRFLYCRLPSGRCLAYPYPKVEMGKTPWGEEREQLSYRTMNNKNQWVRERTYGGKITENITQAVCRDVMAEAMLRLDAAGYRILFTVHDEIVCEAPEDFGSLEEFMALLTEVPVWAEGFPIKAEGWVGPRYRK